MDKSIFAEKKAIPDETALMSALSSVYPIWNQVKDYTLSLNPGAIEEWKFSGDNYGWSFRIKDKKRVIVYLLPRDGFFKTAFVFGQKATDQIMNSTVAKEIKDLLQSAKVYAEGRGIRIVINNEKLLGDIKKLLAIKSGH